MRRGYTLVGLLVAVAISFIFVAMLAEVFTSISGFKTPYENGQESSKMGIEASANPYIRHQRPAKNWLQGWKV